MFTDSFLKCYVVRLGVKIRKVFRNTFMFTVYCTIETDTFPKQQNMVTHGYMENGGRNTVYSGADYYIDKVGVLNKNLTGLTCKLANIA